MNPQLQTIIATILLVCAVAWAVWRIFFKRSQCNCGTSCDCTTGEKKTSCGDCPLCDNCDKKEK